MWRTEVAALPLYSIASVFGEDVSSYILSLKSIYVTITAFPGRHNQDSVVKTLSSRCLPPGAISSILLSRVSQ
jgi:hypothetical protein